MQMKPIPAGFKQTAADSGIKHIHIVEIKWSGKMPEFICDLRFEHVCGCQWLNKIELSAFRAWLL